MSDGAPTVKAEKVVYDFNCVPPRPIETIEFIANPEIQPTAREILCDGLLYVANRTRRLQLYATGRYVDIADFWLEADYPKERNVYQASDGLRVHNKLHLSGPSYTFARVCYELDLLSRHANGESLESIVSANSKVGSLLFHHILSQWDKSHNREYLLIEKRYIDQMYKGELLPPIGLGKSGQEDIGRVALRWHENADCKPVDEAHHYWDECCE